MLEKLFGSRRWPDDDAFFVGVQQQHVAIADLVANALYAAQHGDTHCARDNNDVRGERTFFKHHAAQTPFVIFEQFSRAQIARNQDRVFFQTELRRGTHLTRHNPQQPVG